MSKESRFRGSIENQYGKRAQTMLKSASQDLDQIHWSMATKLCFKQSLLFTCKILQLSINTLAADEKYLYLYRDSLTIPIQMQLSEKKITISRFFAAFLKFRLSFEHFQKKEDPYSFCISEITDSENVVKSCLKSPISEDPSTSNTVNVPKHC